jgi:tetratricopeptide (TPR) repeat protein
MFNIDCSMSKILPILCGMLIASFAEPAFCDIIPYAPEKDSALSIGSDMGKSPLADLDANGTTQRIMLALHRGLWTRACSVATDALAKKESNLDALGIFAICEALVANKEGTERAMSRLQEAEPSPGYYTMLTNGVANLRNGSNELAENAFKRLLETRPGDPLGEYFLGEALHARQKDTEAIATFQKVLKSWPDYAPALSATARLMAAKSASKQNLNDAISMSERAARIDPMNLKYWEQTARLCDQAGQRDRAQAIRLQWLSRPSLPVKK